MTKRTKNAATSGDEIIKVTLRQDEFKATRLNERIRFRCLNMKKKKKKLILKTIREREGVGAGMGWGGYAERDMFT